MTHDPARTWFDVLRAARKSGDRELERMARRELEALGIRVALVANKKREQETRNG